jgi:predicted RND superfamily exporter protein
MRGNVVNYDIIDYLPANAESTQAIKVMGEEFTQSIPNTRVMFPDVSLTEALEWKSRLMAIDGVDDITWLDDIINIKQPLEIQDQAIVQQYYKDGNAAISFSIASGQENRILDEIYALVGEGCPVTGTAVNNYVMQQMAVGQVGLAFAIAIPLILLILILTTRSWLEPLLYFASIGVAVIINLGTNIFFDNVSFVTDSVSPILQLAISLDYAIILLHAFESERQKTGPDGNPVTPAAAMAQALRSSLTTIIACAATVAFGFAALCFMEFGIGADLGVNLLKGTILSLICVATFLPALTLCSIKLLDKTMHRRFLPTFKSAGRHILRLRFPLIILVAIVAVPCFLAVGHTEFLYNAGGLPANTRAAADQEVMDTTFEEQNTLVTLVPRGYIAAESAMSNDLLAVDGVTSVTGYATTVGAAIPPEYLDPAIVDQLYSANYARIIINTKAPANDASSYAQVVAVRDVVHRYYPDDAYTTGTAANLYDMKVVTSSDKDLVDLLSILAIGLVILFIFRSITLPFILVGSIMIAININMAVPYFTAQPIMYIGYMILSTVQLASSADYAILYTSHYMRDRKTMTARQAAEAAHGTSFQPIIVSAAILSFAGFALYFASSITIVQEIGLLLGRGTLISLAIVTCFMPGVMIILDRLVGWTTWRGGFFKGGQEANAAGKHSPLFPKHRRD